MRRFMLAVVALALVVPVAALADHGSSGNTRGVALAKKHHAAKHLRVRREREVRGPVTSLAPLTVGSLTCHVPASGSLPRLHLGDIVEVKCRLVAGRFVLRAIEREDAVADDDDLVRDDERELTGHITSLSPLTVGTLTCAVPSGVSLSGFRVGQLVEITCDFVGGQWVLRRLHAEDDEDDVTSPGRIDDDSSSGPGSGSDHDNSGPGSGDDHSGSDSGSGSGSGHGGGRG